MLDSAELDQLNRGWRTTMMIWGALFASLGIYVVFCYLYAAKTDVTLLPDFPFQQFKMVLYGLSFGALVGAYYLKKTLLQKNITGGIGSGLRGAMRIAPQHPAIGKYTIAIIVAAGLSESVGIFGLVLFILSRDWQGLYLFMTVSGVAMFYFRPRKEELIDLATKMKGEAIS